MLAFFGGRERTRQELEALEERRVPSHIVDRRRCWMLGHGVRRGVVTLRRRASTTQLQLWFRQIDF